MFVVQTRFLNRGGLIEHRIMAGEKIAAVVNLS